MASIRALSTGRTRLLEPEHFIGRAPTCALVIDERYISAQHAVLRWTGDRWELKDLGSRNGTFLNGSRIKPSDEHDVRRGERVAFGKPEQEWELVDEGPPSVMVVPLDTREPEPVLFQGELLALPSSDDPRVTIYRIDSSWVLERSDESITPITNLQTFDVGGRIWRFCCTDNICNTSLADFSAIGLEVRHVQLAFSVSRDEEFVQVQMSCGGSTFDMGSRNFNYLLLTLARRRLGDAGAGLPETTCGWLYQEDLAHDPTMAPPQLNIDVFRIRKQFAGAGVVDAANIIERRPRTRQLRIGTGLLAITQL